jgi:hypothetical protein
MTELRPLTRAEVQRRRALALVLAVAWQAAWLVVLRWRGDRFTVPLGRIALDVLVPVAAAAMAFSVVRSRGARGLGPPVSVSAAAVVLSMGVFAAGALLLGVHAEPDASPFWPHVVRCQAFIAAFSLGPLLLAAWAYRYGMAVASPWRTAALGAACGGLGAATMGLVCATEGSAHLLLGHGAVIVACAIAGAILGPRVLAS